MTCVMINTKWRLEETMIIEKLTEVISNINEGDYLTALTVYEDHVRPNVSEVDSNTHADLVELLNDMNQYIDDENWQRALDHSINIEQYLETLD